MLPVNLVLTITLLSVKRAFGELEVAHQGSDNKVGEGTAKTLTLASNLAQQVPESDIKDHESFISFIKQYSKEYSSNDEVHHRFEVFKQNIIQAKRQEEVNPSAKYGITRFTDLTPDEFANHYANSPPVDIPNYLKRNVSHQVGQEFPAFFDWRDNNGVSAVKHQGNCEAAYAFSVIAAIESQHMINEGFQVHFSEQDIVPCSSQEPYGNQGCQGGTLQRTVNYIIGSGGVTSIQHYPYTSGTNGDAGVCQNVKARVYKILDGEGLPHDEVQISYKIYDNGPVVALYDARQVHNYQGGIINLPPPSDGWTLNQAVLLVGYGQENGVKYWIAKNSRGTDYGEEGFMRIARGQNCLGIEEVTMAVYVEKKAA